MLGNFLATELNVPERLLPLNMNMHIWKGEKENLTDVNQGLLNSFYFKHEIALLEIINKHENVKTFPVNDFLHEWKSFKGDKNKCTCKP